MAFTAPKQWQHGDQPTATEMNKYSSNLDHLEGALLGANFPCSYHHDDEHPADVVISHNRRFLVYKDERDDASLVSWLNSKDTFSLPEAKSGVGILDLEDQIPWMVEGLLYRVTGCIYAIETNYV